MNDDRRTKSQLLTELERAHAALAAAEAKTPAPIEPVPAAQALAGCIRALDLLPKRRTTDPYLRNEPVVDRGEIENILRHLMSRYGVDLVERTTEPCARDHLDDASDAALIDRIRGRF